MDKVATYQRIIKVFYKEGIVSEMQVIDTVIMEEDDIDLLKYYSEISNSKYQDEVFDFDGFKQTSSIQNNMLVDTVILNYEIMDMKKLSKEENWFVKASDIVNEDYKVELEKIEKLILEEGYEVIE